MKTSDRYDELLECDRCGLVGRPRHALCRPVTLFDVCIDHSRTVQPANECDQSRDAARFECAVCSRRSVEPSNICYPRRREELAEGGDRGGRRVKRGRR